VGEKWDGAYIGYVMPVWTDKCASIEINGDKLHGSSTGSCASMSREPQSQHDYNKNHSYRLQTVRRFCTPMFHAVLSKAVLW